MSRTIVSAVLAFVLTGTNAYQQLALAEEIEEGLAMQLANPVAALISVPFQFNYNQNLGPVDDGKLPKILAHAHRERDLLSDCSPRRMIRYRPLLV